MIQTSFLDNPAIASSLSVPFAKGSRTSYAAAEKIAATAQNNRERVLALFRAGAGLTADEVAEMSGLELFVVRPRVTDCRNAGLIVETGEARPNRRGNRCAVLRLATPDEMAAALRRHELQDTKQAQALAAWVRAEMEVSK